MARAIWNLLIELVARVLYGLALGLYLIHALFFWPAVLLSDIAEWLRRRIELQPHNVLEEIADHGTPCSIHVGRSDPTCAVCVLTKDISPTISDGTDDA